MREVTINKIPDEFKEGVRILMLTLRSKEGGKVNKPDRVAKKMVSRNKDDFNKKFAELLVERKGDERIYSTVDARDIEKAIRMFKERQLESDYYDTESRHGFYFDVFNRWISSLQSPRAQVGTLFMVDIDDEKNEYEPIMKEIKENGIGIVYDYPTKNGRHLVLKPFNPALVKFTVLKNHMLLLAY